MVVEFDNDSHYGLFLTNPNTLDSSTVARVRMSELVIAALRAAGILGNVVDGTTAPATDKFWLDKNTNPAVLKEYDPVHSAWMPMTFARLFERGTITALTVTGGTANAVTASEPSYFASDKLYSFVPSATNTGASTITITGVGTYNIKYADGSAISAGELTSGEQKVCLLTGGVFVVLVPTAAVKASETAAAASAAEAEAAAARFGVTDIAAMTALPDAGLSAGDVVYVRDNLRGGSFVALAGTPAANGLTADSGTIFASDGGGFTWQRRFAGAINVDWFGADPTGATLSTAAIDAAFAYIEARPESDLSAINGERGIFRLSGAIPIRVPVGHYRYDGSGFTPASGGTRSVVLLGDGPNSSIISIESDVHLIHVTDDSDVINYVELEGIKFQGGRGAFFNAKTDVWNVQYGKRVRNCGFIGYTSVAFGSLQYSDARWVIQECIFEGGNTGTPVGLALPGEIAEIDISGNAFSSNKYHVIVGVDAGGGISNMTLGPNNDFFNAAVTTRVADIWLVPSASDTRNGQGFTISGNRFSNENGLQDHTILIADRATSSDNVFDHATTVSNGYFREVQINNNIFSRTGTTISGGNFGLIYSYAYRIGGIRARANRIAAIPYFLEFNSSITEIQIDSGNNYMNRFYHSQLDNEWNAPSPIKACNVDGGGMLLAEDGGTYGGGTTPGHAVIRPADYVSIIPNHATSGLSNGGSVTITGQADEDGGSLGAQLEWSADTLVYISTGLVTASMRAGRLAWCEFDVKKASSQSLDGIKLELSIGGGVSGHIIPLYDEVTTVQIPLIWAHDYNASGTFQIRIRPSEFLDAGVKDRVVIGRRALYHANRPSVSAIDYNETELTIASGAISIPTIRQPTFFGIDTEADAAADDLDTINGGQNGDVITLFSAGPTRHATVKDGTGNIQLAGSVDFTLNTTRDTITLIYRSAIAAWVEVSRSAN